VNEFSRKVIPMTNQPDKAPHANVYLVTVTKHRQLVVAVPDGVSETELREVLRKQADDLVDHEPPETQLSLIEFVAVAEVEETADYLAVEHDCDPSWRLSDDKSRVTEEEVAWIEGGDKEGS
jgi:hypothetical protein